MPKMLNISVDKLITFHLHDILLTQSSIISDDTESNTENFLYVILL